jgi:hypothetical protein
MSNNFALLSKIGDFEPDDILTDPGLKRQLEHSWGSGSGDNSDNVNRGSDRLPETYVKTLPFEEDEVSFESACAVKIFKAGSNCVMYNLSKYFPHLGIKLLFGMKLSIVSQSLKV